MPTKKLTLEKKQKIQGWIFLAPAALLILIMSFWPIIQALLMSFQSGTGAAMTWATPIIKNYASIFKDSIFLTSMGNTFFYLIGEVPIMLILALICAQLLNQPNLRFKGIFRTCIFLPCATSLVAYSLIFRTLFANDGLVNVLLCNLHILSEPYAFLQHGFSARVVIILALIWRWTGYNMVFFLAGLQGIDGSVYEAADIDGANTFQKFVHMTVPLLRSTITTCAIMSINGTLQLFDESVNLTSGGPGNASITMSHYIYNRCFDGVANFGYACACSFVILILVAILSMIQNKVGDTRD